MSQIMPRGPWKDLDTPTIELYYYYVFGNYTSKAPEELRKNHPLKLKSRVSACAERAVQREHLSGSRSTADH